jgi:hypothetical protein
MTEIRQEPDQVPMRWIVRLSVATIVAIVLSVVGAYALGNWGGDELARGELGWRTALPADINGIETDFFREPVQQGEAARRRGLDRLERWGWIDQERRIVHAPVDVAVELYLEEQASASPGRRAAAEAP